ncbi:hypothetical protein NQ318_001995 [Aromia moschata]|uniref:Uncharacterized protein n=1 Tax=Aromia moschata TaxID=1265417 RepID=A0AAV8Z3S0_9CUCU|nr:hypothetical protein NQ318_001995 [Aromia moschata]
MSNFQQLLQIAATFRRHYGHTAAKVVPRFQKLKATQKKFQIDDGVPIFLKKGMQDKLLYNATLLLTIFGVGWSLQTFVALVRK